MIPGAKILNFGPPGSGKTTAIRSLIEAGLETLVIFTEDSQSLLNDVKCEKGLHWMFTPPAVGDWATMIENAQKIQNLTPGDLQKLPGMNKHKYGQLINFYKACNDFTCERCQKKFGNLAELSPRHVVVVDSMSPLNTMCLDLAVGGKPVRTQPDWGVAIELEEKIIETFCHGFKCHVVFNAHVDRETDLILGGSKLFPAALGQKLPPKVGKYFSDVIYSRMEGGQWKWSTVFSGAELKTRHLEYKDGLKPSYVPLIEKWKSQGGSIV